MPLDARLLVQAISNLPETEQSVVTLYYGEELLLREIGVILGVTESRVSQVRGFRSSFFVFCKTVYFSGSVTMRSGASGAR